MKFYFLVIASFVLFAAACSSENQSDAPPSLEYTTAERPSEPARKLSGAEIYKTNCAECHGARGEGTDKGISFLEGHALHHKEDDFIRQVTDGEKDEMPAFKDKLTEEEIKSVVKYVREEIQKNASEKESNSHKH